MTERIALIAGGGALPQLIAASAHEQRKDIFIIVLKGIADKHWFTDYPHAVIGIAQVGKLYDLFKSERITHAVMAGHVQRPSFGELIPDWTGWKTLRRLQTKHLQGDDSILSFLAAEIEAQGVTMIGADQLYHDGVMPEGVLTRAQPQADDWADIHFALPVLQHWAEQDLGQAIVVQQKMILGVEALEGTASLINRCGSYQRSGRKAILLKIKKPQQDRRLDLPTVGLDTIKECIAAGFGGIVIDSGNALFLQAPQAVDEANQHGLFIVGIDTAGI